MTGHYTLPILKESLRHSGADLVFLQEVLGESHLRVPMEHSFSGASQYEFLADKIWSDYAYGKNAVYPSGHHGNAILSRYPIQNQQQVNISTYALEQRGILHCSIQLPEVPEPLHTLCVHLGLFGFHRRQQYEMICSYINNNIPAECPLIVAGDLNDWANRADRLLREKLKLVDAFYSCHHKVARTFPIYLPFLPLDRIYVRRLKPLAASLRREPEWQTLSDHLALEAEVQFT